MATESERELLNQQIEYYRARAGEYDQWFLRQGRYDRGPGANRQWFAETKRLEEALDAFAPAGRVLELACGTGLWTRHLARHADSVTAVDASAEVLAINRQRVASAKVRYMQADLFHWTPEQRYDVVLFSFWLSHVPHLRFDGFWNLVRQCLTPEGRFFLIDSLYNSTSTASDHRLGQAQSPTVTRKLNDGREFQIVKAFYQPSELAEMLGQRGWHADVRSTGEFFLYGSGTPIAPDNGG